MYGLSFFINLVADFLKLGGELQWRTTRWRTTMSFYILTLDVLYTQK